LLQAVDDRIYAKASASNTAIVKNAPSAGDSIDYREIYGLKPDDLIFGTFNRRQISRQIAELRRVTSDLAKMGK